MFEIFVKYLDENNYSGVFFGGFFCLGYWSDGIFFYVFCIFRKDGILVKDLVVK